MFQIKEEGKRPQQIIELFSKTTNNAVIHLQELPNFQNFNHFSIISQEKVRDILFGQVEYPEFLHEDHPVVLQHNQALSVIFETLGQNCRFLLRLNLEHNYIHDDSVKVLSEAQLKHLKHINLWYNYITAEGVKYLTNCQYNYLTYFNIKQNQIGNRGVKYICKAKWPKLDQLFIYGNGITDGWKYFKKSKNFSYFYQTYNFFKTTFPQSNFIDVCTNRSVKGKRGKEDLNFHFCYYLQRIEGKQVE